MNAKLHNYVSLLMFSTDRKKVVLLVKNQPVFLNGKLCPVGGRIGDGEDPDVAAAREFVEETGVQTAPDEWLRFALCEGADWLMHCFVSFDDQAFNCRTTTDEQVHLHDVDELLTDVANCPELAASDLIALMGLAMQAGVREGHAVITYA